MTNRIVFILLILIGFSCRYETAEIKNQARSEMTLGKADERSTSIVEKMMAAMGGKEKWEELKYVSWTFFGVRQLTWDKVNERVRIVNPKDTSIYLVDLKNNTGRYAKNGIEEKDKVKLKKHIKRGKSIWINDMYWLFMPFKLRDLGVTIHHIGVDTLYENQLADILQLTFEGVGDTPENMYHLYVDQSDHLIKVWDFYAKSDQEKPNKSWPWDNYSNFGGLLLSQERSDGSGPSKVEIYEQLEDKVFTEF